MGVTCECDQCGIEVTHRVVTQTRAIGLVRRFCSDSCERLWLNAELDRCRYSLNAIRLGSRDRFARDIAQSVLRRSLTT